MTKMIHERGCPKPDSKSSWRNLVAVIALVALFAWVALVVLVALVALLALVFQSSIRIAIGRSYSG